MKYSIRHWYNSQKQIEIPPELGTITNGILEVSEENFGKLIVELCKKYTVAIKSLSIYVTDHGDWFKAR